MKSTALLIWLVLALFYSIGHAKKPPKPPPVPCNPIIQWCDMGIVPNVGDSHTPIIPMGGDQIRVFSNTDGSTLGNLYLRVGSWAGVGSASMGLHISDPRDDWIRTLGCDRGKLTGHYFCVLYTGDDYPTQGGYSPSWATSSDGYDWATYQMALPQLIQKRLREKLWWGPIGIFGRNQSSAMNLLVDETRIDAYACMAWLDIGNSLYLMHAASPCSPSDWQSDGINQWPIPGEQPLYCSATRTSHGVEMICAINYPATAHRRVFSCTGFPPWTVVEMDAATRSGLKGTNLSYDAATDEVNAVTTGRRWKTKARAQQC